MHVDVERRGEIAIVQLNEPRLDHTNTDRWSEILMELAAESPRAIIIDLQSVLYVDSRGLMPFLTTQAALNPKGTVCLCGVSEQLEQTLRHMNIHKILKIQDDLDSAIEAVGAEDNE